MKLCECPKCGQKAMSLIDFLNPFKNVFKLHFGFLHTCGARIFFSNYNFSVFGMFYFLLSGVSFILVSFVFQNVLWLIYLMFIPSLILNFKFLSSIFVKKRILFFKLI